MSVAGGDGTLRGGVAVWMCLFTPAL
uniref:Uncharacterized protein n=1 Tax=Anguilla anguilla TaxID=7936 RepID=A0A0E9SPV0_ANGAN